MIVALMLMIDVALMCYLAWQVASAAKPGAPQDLGWLSFREERVGAASADTRATGGANASANASANSNANGDANGDANGNAQGSAGQGGSGHA